MKSCERPESVLVDVARLAPTRIRYRVTGVLELEYRVILNKPCMIISTAHLVHGVASFSYSSKI
jgi:hypothetical protein